MKLKYYLRGLGIGILVTGLIMGISNKKAVSQAKDEVRKVYEQENREEETDEMLSSQTQEESARGEEETVQPPAESQNQEDSAANQEPSSVQETTQQNSSANENEDEDNASPEQASTPDNADIEEEEGIQDASNIGNNQGADNAENNTANSNVSKDGITIQVSGGDDSGVVSRKLYNAGLIENAAEFDAFLMQHGYDKKIATGAKTFYAGESWQEIAEKLIK